MAVDTCWGCHPLALRGHLRRCLGQLLHLGAAEEELSRHYRRLHPDRKGCGTCFEDVGVGESIRHSQLCLHYNSRVGVHVLHAALHIIDANQHRCVGMRLTFAMRWEDGITGSLFSNAGSVAFYAAAYAWTRLQYCRP